MPPLLPVRHLPEYFRRRLINHLNAGEIRQAPDLLGQGAVCPLYNFLTAFGVCGVSHEANFTTRTSDGTWSCLQPTSFREVLRRRLYSRPPSVARRDE